MFMPEISADDLSKMNLSGTPLENLTPEQIEVLEKQAGVNMVFRQKTSFPL